MCNPFFRLDDEVNKGAYSKALSYLYIPEEKKSKKQDLIIEYIEENIINKFENDLKTKLNEKIILIPPPVTTKEIEEFIQRSYDLYSICVDRKIEPTSNFYKSYKAIGIEKNFERISGEFIDYFYIPVILLEFSYGSEKKGEFKTKGEYQWALISPFFTPQNPWNEFIKIQFNPDSLFPLINLISKICK